MTGPSSLKVRRRACDHNPLFEVIRNHSWWFFILVGHSIGFARAGDPLSGSPFNHTSGHAYRERSAGHVPNDHSVGADDGTAPDGDRADDFRPHA